MNTVRIDVAKLRGEVAKNRDQHAEEYAEAFLGYREAVGRRLDEMRVNTAKAEVVEDVETNIHKAGTYLTAPKDHRSDYDAVLAMLEFTVDNTVELTQEQFRAYVLDDWDWSREFKMSHSNYTGTRR